MPWVSRKTTKPHYCPLPRLWFWIRPGWIWECSCQRKYQVALMDNVAGHQFKDWKPLYPYALRLRRRVYKYV